jgi:hypothetical protein
LKPELTPKTAESVKVELARNPPDASAPRLAMTGADLKRDPDEWSAVAG